MANGTATPYDDVLYPGHAHSATHIARLATLGWLYGIDPGPIAHTRVLELGCGNGGNLIPMAYQYPDSEFIGVDLSKSAVANGLKNVSALDLRNIELRHCDIMDVGAELGRFDYVIAHGVYSWVRAEVRNKILAIFASHLSPHGIGYVSYNAYPGSHLRNIIRDAMLYHVSDIDDPTNRVGQARAILKMLSDASSPNSVYSAVIRDQFERVQHMSDQFLFHDDLSSESTAFLLHDVLAAAKPNGLQYLCDAVLSRRDLSRYPENVRNALAQFPDNAFAARDQYQDFIDGFGFRRTLLCYSDIQLNRSLTPNCITRLLLACSSNSTSRESGPRGQSTVKFVLADGSTLTTDHPLSIAAFSYLGKCWPATVSFPVLLQNAAHPAPINSSDPYSDEHVQTLVRVLFDAAGTGQVELYLYPNGCTTTMSERPQASLLARKQAEASNRITSLRHEEIRLEDERVRRFLLLVDGTRNIEQLVSDLRETTSDLPLRQDQPAVTRESIETHLELLAKLALLVA